MKTDRAKLFIQRALRDIAAAKLLEGDAAEQYYSESPKVKEALLCQEAYARGMLTSAELTLENLLKG